MINGWNVGNDIRTKNEQKIMTKKKKEDNVDHVSLIF